MKYMLTLLMLLIALPVQAGVYCQWSGTAPEGCLREKTTANGVTYLPTKPGLSGGETNYNSKGFYKLVTIRPDLVAGNMYSGTTFALVGNNIEKTLQQVVNPNAPTLNDKKIAKYQEVKAVRDGIVEADCSYSGFTIPESTREAMRDGISANMTLTYEVINESNGFPAGFTRTPAQAQAVLTACLTTVEEANQHLWVDNQNTVEVDAGLSEAIRMAPDSDKVQEITWDYLMEVVPAGT